MKAMMIVRILADTGNESARDITKEPRLWNTYEVSDDARDRYSEKPDRESLSMRYMRAGTNPITDAAMMLAYRAARARRRRISARSIFMHIRSYRPVGGSSAIMIWDIFLCLWAIYVMGITILLYYVVRQKLTELE